MRYGILCIPYTWCPCKENVAWTERSRRKVKMMRRDAVWKPCTDPSSTAVSLHLQLWEQSWICDVIHIQSVVLFPSDPSKAIVAQVCTWGSFGVGSSLSSRPLNASSSLPDKSVGCWYCSLEIGWTYYRLWQLANYITVKILARNILASPWSSTEFMIIIGNN